MRSKGRPTLLQQADPERGRVVITAITEKDQTKAKDIQVDVDAKAAAK